MIRYNYYIDNMPISDLNELESEQKKRLEQLSKTKKLQNMETTALILEVNNDYARTMNKIIFDRFIEDNQNEMNNRDLFPVQLTLPSTKNDHEVPEMGMMELERTKGAKVKLLFENL
jgi:dynein heavy chain